jgi:Domain of unknown function (DUF1844)
MTDPATTQNNPLAQASADENSVLFAQLVLQQTNMALMLLGRAGHPEGAEAVKDLDGAKLFIDLLEMLQVKTKGNLNAHEAQLLKQNLVSLRLAYVDAVDSSARGKTPESTSPPAGGEGAKPAPPPEEESHKKFSKKY